MWMPDDMYVSENGGNAFDGLGLYAGDVQYDALFDLVVGSHGRGEGEDDFGGDGNNEREGNITTTKEENGPKTPARVRSGLWESGRWVEGDTRFSGSGSDNGQIVSADISIDRRSSSSSDTNVRGRSSTSSGGDGGGRENNKHKTTSITDSSTSDRSKTASGISTSTTPTNSTMKSSSAGPKDQHARRSWHNSPALSLSQSSLEQSKLCVDFCRHKQSNTNTNIPVPPNPLLQQDRSLPPPTLALSHSHSSSSLPSPSPHPVPKMAAPPLPLRATRSTPTKTMHMHTSARYTGNSLPGQQSMKSPCCCLSSIYSHPLSTFVSASASASSESKSGCNCELESTIATPITSTTPIPSPASVGVSANPPLILASNGTKSSSNIDTPSSYSSASLSHQKVIAGVGVGKFPPTVAEKKFRSLRRRKSRDLHQARRAYLSMSMTAATKMGDTTQQQHMHNTTATTADSSSTHSPTPPSTAPSCPTTATAAGGNGLNFDKVLAYSSSQSLSSVPRYAPSDISSRPLSSRSDYSIKSPFSLSAENLSSAYTNDPVTLARPHSMSSLSTPTSMNEQHALQYSMRRASVPTDSAMFYEQPVARGLSIDYDSWMPQQSFDHLPMPSQAPSIKTEQPEPWWDENAKVEIQRLNVLQSQSGDEAPTSTVGRYASSHHSPYGSLLYVHQPPSPAFDDEDSGIYPHSMASPIPSPPESPDFYFPSAMATPEIGFPHTTPSMARGGSPPVTAAAAAAAALTASKPSKLKSSRPGSSSRRKTSMGSMRSQAKPSASPALGETEMAFVNYTPQDKTRILNGVAPSGSSKTKARREREANEKRMKLAAAAAAAVEAAGGDASVLANVV